MAEYSLPDLSGPAFRCDSCGRLSQGEAPFSSEENGTRVDYCSAGCMVQSEGLTFDAWLAIGNFLGYCSEQFCETHDGGPFTEAEYAAWDNGDDPCRHVVRLGTPEDWDGNIFTNDVDVTSSSD